MKVTKISLFSFALAASLFVATGADIIDDSNDKNLRHLMTSGDYPLSAPCDDEMFQMYAPCGPFNGDNTRICLDTRDGKGLCVLASAECGNGCDEETSVCVGGTCQCLVGYEKNEGTGKCEAKCDKECGGVHSHCSNGKCVCNDGFGYNSYRTTCIKGGSPCFEQCSEHSICRLNGECECQSGFVDENKNVPDASVSCVRACPEWFTCDDSANSHCVAGACRCKAGYEPVGESEDNCKLIETPSQGAVSTCYPECGDNSKCVNGSCKCDDGYVMNRRGRCRIQLLGGGGGDGNGVLSNIRNRLGGGGN